MTRIIEKNGTVLVERFSPMRRAEHILVLVTFIALVVTGLPQKFDGSFSTWLLGVMGGLDNARLIHRVFGIVFSVHAAVHIVGFIMGVLLGRMRLTLLPTLQDLRDARENLLYYLGLRKKAPELPKFDYRQKFEYIGMVLGGLVMVASGLILLFPQLASGFMPGQFIPAAKVAHSNEAMLALLVLIVWHVYGSHLSPEVFPMDTSVFTGFMTKEELRERHALEFRRLFPGEPVEHEHEAVAGAEGETVVAPHVASGEGARKPEPSA